MNNLILRTLTSPYINDVTRGSVLSQADVDNNFIFLKGNIIYTAETIGNIVTLKRFNGDDLSFIAGETFTGGTISGATNYTNGLSANTFSATTYYNLPQDIYVTGGTYTNGSTIFTNNSGGTFNVYSTTTYAAGVISGASGWSKVVPNDGQINLPAIKVALYNNADNIEPILVYDVASGTTGVGGIPSLTDNDTNYLVVEYNGGSPRYNVYNNDGLVDDSSVVLCMIIYRLGNFVHTLEFGNQGAGLANKLNDRFIMTNRFGYESGLIIGLSGTGVVTLTSGVAWNGTNRQVLNQCDSSGNTFFKNYHVGGSWTATTTGDTFNNSYYDDGTDIVSGTTGKYLTNWYFRGQEINDHLYEVYGVNEYDSVILAEASPEPILPELITSHAFLVGRIIVGVGETTGVTQTAFGVVFQSSGTFSSTSIHNDLTGLQGGLGGEYYHLNFNQYNNLPLTNSVNNFTTGQTFSGGLSANTISATTYYNLPSGAITIVNTSSLFSTGLVDTGLNASGVTNSIFLGNEAGYQASGASGSNFLGNQAGYQATIGYASNFLGNKAGYQASGANHSNFLGNQAGQEATDASFSNFFGEQAGYGATDANDSNFFGNVAGNGATGASSSNFFGQLAGYQAINANDSNFFGYNVGYLATGASNSNFFGKSAGYLATDASNSNFFGKSAGYQATSASNSNFFGNGSGYQATNASDSNFMGSGAGGQAIYAFSSNFMGSQAGFQATGASYSNFMGNQAGYGATDANSSNFMGSGAGGQAIYAFSSNFFGPNAGYGATDANSSNFIGQEAGYLAISANSSNFFGVYAGSQAINANNSNFFGYLAGREAVNANNSNFIGQEAGDNAINADNSNFLGNSAGNNAINAANSIFIGNQAGFYDTVSNTSPYDDSITFADTSILIGHKTSTGGYSNSVALGAYAINTSSNQLVVGSVERPISGLTIANVAYKLPTTQGSANTFLNNDGSGNLTWSTINTSANLGRILYVSISGNNSTAVVGDITKPYATTYAAKLAAVSGDTIHVFPQTITYNNSNALGNQWNNRQNEINLWKNGVTWYFEPNCKVQMINETSAGQNLYLVKPSGNTLGDNCTVLGYLEFQATGIGANSSNGAMYYFDGTTIGSDSGFTFYSQTKSLVSYANQVITVNRGVTLTGTGMSTKLTFITDTLSVNYLAGQGGAGALVYLGGSDADMDISLTFRESINSNSYLLYYGTQTARTITNIKGDKLSNSTRRIFNISNCQSIINVNIKEMYYGTSVLAGFPSVISDNSTCAYTLNLNGNLLEYQGNTAASYLFQMGGSGSTINYNGDIYTNQSSGAGRRIGFVSANNNTLNITGNINYTGAATTTSTAFITSGGVGSVVNFKGKILGNFACPIADCYTGTINIENSNIKSIISGYSPTIMTNGTSSLGTINIRNSYIELKSNSNLSNGSYVKGLVNNSMIANTGSGNTLSNTTAFGSLQLLNTTIISSGISVNHTSTAPVISSNSQVNTAPTINVLYGNIDTITEITY